MTGAELKAIRLRLGLTQAEMADKLFLKGGARYICEMESGRLPVSHRTSGLSLLLQRMKGACFDDLEIV